jgi:acyl-coenzyme A synthetase/AMP-(fatty) acid ligase
MKRTDMVDYETARREFSWDVPSTFNFGADVVDRWAEDPTRLALIWCNDQGKERRFTFADIRRLSNRLANLLRDQGVKKGDRVLVMLPRIPEWQIAMVACLKLGAIPVPCITMQTARDIAYRTGHSGAVAAITTRDNISKFAGDHVFRTRISVGGGEGWLDFEQASAACSDAFTPVEMGSEEPAILYYTSGSTGDPKGVTHSARGLFTWRVSAWYWLTVTEEDVIWCTADTGWSKAGTSILFGPWSCGTAVLFYDGPFEPQKRFELLERYSASSCWSATGSPSSVPRRRS